MKRMFPLLLLVLCVIAAQADLKSWRHVAPPNRLSETPDATAATVSFAPNVVPDKQVLDFVRAFARTMRGHNGAAKIEVPNETIVTSIQTEGDARIAKVDFKSDSHPTETRVFRFDSAGKLLSANSSNLSERN